MEQCRLVMSISNTESISVQYPTPTNPTVSFEREYRGGSRGVEREPEGNVEQRHEQATIETVRYQTKWRYRARERLPTVSRYALRTGRATKSQFPS